MAWIEEGSRYVWDVAYRTWTQAYDQAEALAEQDNLFTEVAQNEEGNHIVITSTASATSRAWRAGAPSAGRREERNPSVELEVNRSNGETPPLRTHHEQRAGNACREAIPFLLCLRPLLHKGKQTLVGVWFSYVAPKE